MQFYNGSCKLCGQNYLISHASFSEVKPHKDFLFSVRTSQTELQNPIKHYKKKENQQRKKLEKSRFRKKRGQEFI